MLEIIFIAVGIIAIFVGFTVAANGSKRLKNTGDRYERESASATKYVGFGIAGIGAILAVVFALTSMTYSQTQGEAKVLLNIDGTVSGTDVTPGFGTKAPWQSTVDFDLFSQTLQFAGGKDGAPSYTGGTVNGGEITAPVKGGAQSNFDLSMTYSLDADNVEDIYKQFKSQERFTQQVLVNKALATIRKVPAAYSPVEFRGEKSGEAQETMLTQVQDALEEYGVNVSILNTQNITFSESVEASIQQVEQAQQNEEKARAELRATEVSAQAQVVEATAEAEANRLRSESLTPQVIEAKRIEAYLEAAKQGSLIVVPEGSQPIVGSIK